MKKNYQEKVNDFIKALPNEFTTPKAHQIGEEAGLGWFQIKKLLNEDPHIKRVKRGHYIKKG